MYNKRKVKIQSYGNTNQIQILLIIKRKKMADI